MPFQHPGIQIFLINKLYLRKKRRNKVIKNIFLQHSKKDRNKTDSFFISLFTKFTKEWEERKERKREMCVPWWIVGLSKWNKHANVCTFSIWIQTKHLIYIVHRDVLLTPAHSIHHMHSHMRLHASKRAIWSTPAPYFSFGYFKISFRFISFHIHTQFHSTHMSSEWPNCQIAWDFSRLSLLLLLLPCVSHSYVCIRCWACVRLCIVLLVGLYVCVFSRLNNGQARTFKWIYPVETNTCALTWIWL